MSSLMSSSLLSNSSVRPASTPCSSNKSSMLISGFSSSSSIVGSEGEISFGSASSVSSSTELASNASMSSSSTFSDSEVPLTSFKISSGLISSDSSISALLSSSVP